MVILHLLGLLVLLVIMVTRLVLVGIPHLEIQNKDRSGIPEHDKFKFHVPDQIPGHGKFKFHVLD